MAVSLYNTLNYKVVEIILKLFILPVTFTAFISLQNVCSVTIYTQEEDIALKLITTSLTVVNNVAA